MEFIKLACECLEVNLRDLASRRQDSATGRVRRLIAACGIERWNQRAGDVARVMRKHSVVVSRWVSEAGRIRNEDNDFAKDLDALDQAMSTLAIERLAEIRAVERES
jgi:hypothetical protein